MQIHIFENIIEKVEPRWKMVLPATYYTNHYNILNILYILLQRENCFIYHILSL